LPALDPHLRLPKDRVLNAGASIDVSNSVSVIGWPSHPDQPLSARSPLYVAGQAPGSGVASVTAGHLRGLGLKLVRRPEVWDPHHVEIVGNKSRGARRRIKEAAHWVVTPKATVP
jgi:hypothetical protein